MINALIIGFDDQGVDLEFLVDRRLQHTNRCAKAVTCSFLLPLARERRAAAAGATEGAD